MSYVYLFHFEKPISSRHTCQHYIGYADDLASRVQDQWNGGSKAARLLQIAKQRGIGVELVRAWRGDRTFERQLKNRKNGPRLCPVCGLARPIGDELSLDEIEDALLPF